MSMNGHAKRTIQTLEALDFQLDEDATGRGVRVYWHPNDPDARLKVFSGLSEIAAKKLRNRADQIVGMSTAGERIPASIRENARIRKQVERAEAKARAEREAKEREPFQAMADDRARRVEFERRVNAERRRQRELRELMGA